jgi:hypothetical protein
MRFATFLQQTVVSFATWYASQPAPPDPPPVALPAEAGRMETFDDVGAILESHRGRVSARGDTTTGTRASVRRVLGGVKADFGIAGGFVATDEDMAELETRLAIDRVLRAHLARMPGGKARLASMEMTGRDDAPPPWKAKIGGLDVPPPEATTPRPAPGVHASP